MEPERLYTRADLIEYLGTTFTKFSTWIQRSDSFVPPEFVAGRNNNKGSFMMHLWTEDQLEEIKAAYMAYEKKKEEKQSRKPTKDKEKLRKYYRNYRKDRKKEREEKAKRDLAELAERLERENPAPKPVPRAPKPLTFRPLSEDIITDLDDDRDREERAFQFLLDKGLV